MNRAEADEDVDPPDPLTISEDEAVLRLPEVGTFKVTSDGDIEARPREGVTEGKVEAQTTGPVLGLKHLLQDRLVLHGSAVASDGRAVAVVGGREWGKSTTAGLLMERGWDFVTDDILALEQADGDHRVLPGPPRLKLWPEGVELLGRDPDALPRIYPASEKRLLEPEPPAEAVRLQAIYILDPEAAESGALADGPEPLSGQEAMMELVRHTYRVRAFSEAQPDDHFRRCQALAEEVPVRRVARPGDRNRAPDVAAAIEADARDLAGTEDPAGVDEAAGPPTGGEPP